MFIPNIDEEKCKRHYCVKIKNVWISLNKPLNFCRCLLRVSISHNPFLRCQVTEIFDFTERPLPYLNNENEQFILAYPNDSTMSETNAYSYFTMFT